MGTVKVTNIEPIADNGTVTLGGSGDTITLGSGATVTGNGLVGITMADQWRLTANLSAPSGRITSNLEQVDTTGQGIFGTGMSESSGIFTFPETGMYLVKIDAVGNNNNADNLILNLRATTDNSTYNVMATARNASSGNAAANVVGLHTSTIIDVTDTSNVKVDFHCSSFGTGSVLEGNTTLNLTAFTFIRLGDT